MKNHGFKRKYVYGGAGIFDGLLLVELQNN